MGRSLGAPYKSFIFDPRGLQPARDLLSTFCYLCYSRETLSSPEEKPMLRMIVLVAIGWIVGLSARALMPGKGPDWLLGNHRYGCRRRYAGGGRRTPRGLVASRRCSRIHPVTARRDHAAGAISRAEDQTRRVNYCCWPDCCARGSTGSGSAGTAAVSARVSCPASSSAGRTLTSTDRRCPACPL